MTIDVTNLELVLIFLETSIPNEPLFEKLNVHEMKRTKSAY